ncbi:MAG: O-antigen ligase family protein [Acidimicrobiales bacterium]
MTPDSTTIAADAAGPSLPVPGDASVPSSPPVRVLLAALTIVLMAFPLVLRGFGDPKLSFDYVTIIFPVDIALALLLLTGAVPVARRILARTAGPGTTLWALLALVMSLAWVFHPSTRGVHTVFELWGTAVLAGTLAEALATGFADLVFGTIAAVAVLESAWATVQLVTGASLGLQALGEDVDPFLRFSSAAAAPMGSTVHIYVLAGFALVAAGALAWRATTSARPLGWLIAAGLAVMPVGFTYSRAGLAGFILLVAGFAIEALRRRAGGRRAAAAVLALCLGAGVPAAVWSAGWTNRADQTTSARNGAQLTTERTRLIHEAAAQISAHPATGVGPGRYVIALKDRYKVETDPVVKIFKPVHNLVLLAGAEGGILALIVMATLFVALAWRSLAAGPIAAGIYLAYLPFCMLDHFPYSFPQGLVVTAIWLGVLDVAARRRPLLREAAVDDVPV